MKKILLVLVLSLLVTSASAQYSFSLPGDGNWYRVATAGGMHAHFEYQYAHNTGNTPSVCSGEIDFINAQNFTIQQHQTMGYAYWDQPQFALLNFGNTSEIWVKATTGVDAGTFTVTHSLQTNFDTTPVADADLADNGGTLTIYDKLPDNSHVFYGNTIVKNGNVGIGISNPASALDVGGAIQISSVNQNTPPTGLSYGLFPYGGIGLGIFSGATDPNQGMGFWTNPYGVKTEVMRISAGGNVSIGTTASTGLLTLNSTPGAQVSLQTNGTPIANLSVNSNSSMWNGGYGVGLNMAATAADISLQTGAPAATSLIVKNSGNVGIGTTNPYSKLHIAGGGLVVGANAVTDNLDGALSLGNVYTSYDPWQGNWAVNGSTMILSALGYSTIAFHHSGLRVDFIRAGGGNIQIGYDGGWGMPNVVLPNGIWNSAGYVGVGTTTVPSGYKMAVAGNAIAESMTVKLQANWPDYVFKKDHPLLPLSEIKAYIDKNQHLPEVPTAEQVSKNGINLGEMNTLLMKKVEELTLYLLELKKDNDLLNQRISKLEAKN